MSIFDEPITVAERYATAIETSDLAVREERCSVDYLIAVGWCHDGLGTRLHRLRAEWDAARAEMRTFDAWAAQQDDVSVRAFYAGDETTALRLQLEVEEAASTARAIALVAMPTLRDATDALHGYSIALATRRGFMQPDDVVQTITSRALQLWIDPLCAGCNGLGKRGGYLSPQVNCSACGGTGKRALGKRPFKVHDTDEGRAFGDLLMDEMTRKVKAVAREIGLYLHRRTQHSAKKVAAARDRQALVLSNLRSTQAQED